MHAVFVRSVGIKLLRLTFFYSMKPTDVINLVSKENGTEEDTSVCMSLDFSRSTGRGTSLSYSDTSVGKVREHTKHVVMGDRLAAYMYYIPV